MPIDILMPALSPTMTSGNIAKWIIKEGEKVKNGKTLVEIQTDKAIMELDSTEDGVLAKVLIGDGANDVAVGELIAIMLEEGEECDVEKYLRSKQKQEVKKPEAVIEKKETKRDIKANTCEVEKNRIFISPLAKRIANEKNIDYSSIEGSGPHGRIVKVDIENIKPNFAKTGVNRNKNEFEIVSLSPMRKVIAQRLSESKLQSPHFYVSVDVCIEELNKSRAIINDKNTVEGVKLSINDFVVKATALALKDFKAIRSIWADDVLKICNNIDISVAVSIDGGLITPIVKNADQKCVFEISKEVKELAKKAKNGSLLPNEYQGGCFTISNMGMFGVSSFYGIVNPPQSAILCVASPIDRVVFENGICVNKKFVNFGLSADHRVVDGTDGARFLNKIKEFIENPILMFI